jgi:hypothetical protein
VVSAADTEEPPQTKIKNMKTLTKLMPAMKNAILAVVLLTSVITANAQGYHYVRPYIRHNGTFVSGHYQTNPDGNIYNNWSTYPNVNPFTGRAGTIKPYGGLHTMPYSSGLDSASGDED